jgi:hypothetical protein
MRTFSTTAASTALLSAFAIAHPHETGAEVQACKFDQSKRCVSSVAAMNKKRWAKWGEKHLVGRGGNTIGALTTEAPYLMSSKMRLASSPMRLLSGSTVLTLPPRVGN